MPGRTPAHPLRILAACLCLGAVDAAVYHVDFAAGDDARPGLTPEQAWKHAPGDPAATLGPAQVKLAGGDTVRFRAGVVYRGSIKVPASGAPEARIVYTGSGWGEGRAIIDGSDPVTGWQRCASAEEAYGNPHFAEIFATTVEAASPFRINLHETDAKTGSDDFLWPAQEPNPKDFFFYNRTDSFWTVKHADISRTAIVSEHLDQKSADHYQDALALVWVNDNRIRLREIESFIPAEKRITFKDLGENTIYPERDQFFAIKNSPHAIDTPGEFFLSRPGADGKRRLLLWPRHGERLDERISAARRSRGIDLGSCSHIEVSGFEIRKFSGAGMFDGTGIVANADAAKPSSGLCIRNNLIRHNASDENGYGGIHLGSTRGARVEDNHVAWNIGNRGIFLSDIEDAVVRRNRIEFAGGTGLPIYRGRRVQVLDNVISDIYATHANGLTLYIACQDVLVAGNRITDAQTPITFQDSGNLWFINNVTDGNGVNKNVNEWPNTKRGPWATGRIVFLNNTFVRATVGAALSIGGDPEKEYLVVNNILDGGAFSHKRPDLVKRSHNLYTGLNNFQDQRYGWKLAEGEAKVPDLGLLFQDPKALDYRLLPEGPMRGSGKDVSDLYPRAAFPDVDFAALIGERKPMHIGASPVGK